MAQPKTFQSAMGMIGERSVMRTLILNHFYMELQPAGCTDYFIQREEKAETQGEEIDIVEEWVDADGKMWRRVHEVKCETLTLHGEYGNPGKEYERLAGREVMGSGNVFIETIQRIGKGEYYRILNRRKNVDIVPELNTQKQGRKGFLGWYYVMEKTQADIEKVYNAGRWVWFVAYVPKGDKFELYNAQIMGEDKRHGLIKTANGVRWKTFDYDDQLSNFVRGNQGLVLHSMTYENFVHMMAEVKQKPQIVFHEAESDDGKGLGYGSVGYLVKLKKYVFDKFTYKDGCTIEGIEDTKRGGKIYGDLLTWVREKPPGNYTTWTDDDWKTGHFEYCAELNIEETDDARLFIGDFFNGIKSDSKALL